MELQGGSFVLIEALEVSSHASAPVDDQADLFRPKLLIEGNIHPNTKLNAQQSGKMIKIAAKPPRERQSNIEAIRASERYEGSEKFEARGIEVSPDITKLQGRVIHPPRVEYMSPPPKVGPK